MGKKKLVKSLNKGRDYVIQKVMTKTTLPKFEFRMNKRKRRQGNYNSILRGLKNGQFFESLLVVNKVTATGKLRIIDGNHRVESLEQYYMDYPSALDTTLYLVEYKNLTIDQEQEIYSLWNHGSKESSDDFIKGYAYKLDILKLMHKDFPCPARIYRVNPKQDGIHFTGVIKAYLAKDQWNARGWNGNRIQLMTKVMLLGVRDHQLLKEYVEMFIRVFGKPAHSTVNRYCTTTIQNCLVKIWFNEIQRPGGVDAKKLEKLFKKQIWNDSKVKEDGKLGGQQATVNMYNYMVELLNQKVGSRGTRIVNTINKHRQEELEKETRAKLEAEIRANIEAEAKASSS